MQNLWPIQEYLFLKNIELHPFGQAVTIIKFEAHSYGLQF